ncbi:uncharacterized protein LOC144107552 [Amblyomma americanum]
MAASLGWMLALVVVAVTCASGSGGVAIPPWRWQFPSRHRALREQNRCAPDGQAMEIGERATCPFDVFLSVDPKRIPAEIPMASCRCPKYQCGPDRNCVTLSYKLDVVYNVSGVLKTKQIEATSACVCALPQLVPTQPTAVADRRYPRADDPGYYLMH